MRLDHFDNSGFDRGRSWFVEAAWRTVQGLLVGSWLPGSAWRVTVLRLFGARVGRGVRIKPHVRVTFPWKLRIGDHSWIGESVWIDNLAPVEIGANCCVSQGAYLCTGSHRWDRETFDLETRPVILEDACWVGAWARLAPGVTCREGSVLTMGSVATADLESWSIHGGSPAARLKSRSRPESDANSGS